MLRFVGQVALGGALGVMTGLVGAVIGSSMENCSGGSGSEPSFCGLGGGLVGAALFDPFGVAVGVHSVGNAGNQTGSFGRAVGGAYLGAVLGTGLELVKKEAGFPGFMIGAPVTSAAVFASGRRYKIVPDEESLRRALGDLRAGPQDRAL